MNGQVIFSNIHGGVNTPTVGSFISVRFNGTLNVKNTNTNNAYKMTPHKTDIKQQKMGDKYVSNALMMSTKNNLYEHIPFFLYCYLMKATIVFVNLLSHYLQRAYDEDATIYHFWYIIVVDAP